MNKQWKRKSFFPWVGGNNNTKKFITMAQYSRDTWSPKSWNSFKGERNDYQFRPQRKQNRRNSFRWETLPDEKDFNFPKETFKRNDFSRNTQCESTGPNGNVKRGSRIYLKWCQSVIEEKPSHAGLRMRKKFWDKLDAKDDIRICWKEAKKYPAIPPYDGVTPRGVEGIMKAWRCDFCGVVFLDLENKNLHLLERKHYVRYSNFCKRYAEEKLLKNKLMIKEKKRNLRKSSKSDNNKLGNVEEKEEDDNQVAERNAKDIKDSIKTNQTQEIKEKSSATNHHYSSLEDISIEDELNYDYLE